jgi:hypothetical protein
VINHNVVGLDIAVHDSLGVAEVQRLKKLKDVVADIKVGESRV